MPRLDVDLTEASDALRSELIFLPEDGRISRIAGGFCILTPSNPTFWWGNTLRMDRPPAATDLEPWTALFKQHVHDVQPASSHMTFGWDGYQQGDVDRFLAAGFTYFETIGLAVHGRDAVAAPHPAHGAEIVAVDSDADWNDVLAIEVEVRDKEVHTEEAHTVFIRARIAGWRELQAAGQGQWFGIRDDGHLVATLGVFAEKERGPDGRRIGRFQNVATLPNARRRGYAGTLVAHATRHAFDRLDVDTVRIAADENDVARRVYEACGYKVVSRHRGLERGS